MRDHCVGYKGYIPGRKFNTIENREPEVPKADIPGYSGYVFAYKPENVYGKTFSLMTREIKCGTKYRDRENFDDKPQSIFKESYENPANVDGKHNLVPTTKVSFFR